MKNMKLYSIWKSIKQRCYNPNSTVYQYYGAQGITMFKGWLSNYLAFAEYVSSLPNFDGENLGHNGLTLDRIKGKKGYRPGNLQWITMERQCRNRRKKSGTKSKYIGVSQDLKYPSKRNWSARITLSGKTIRIGRYLTEIQARDARDKYIKENRLENFMLNP